MFVEDSAAIPDLTGLDQFTNYSVQMALVNSDNQTCLFGDPVFAMTGKYVWFVCTCVFLSVSVLCMCATAHVCRTRSKHEGNEGGTLIC